MWNRCVASLMMLVLLVPKGAGQGTGKAAPVGGNSAADIFAPPSAGHPCGVDLALGKPDGIFVEHLKSYDDAMLQQQLELNMTRLAALTGLDQGSLISHLGNVSGMNQSFSSLSFNIQGPPTAQRIATAAIPNAQTVQTSTVSSGTTAASNGQSVPVSNNQLVTQTTSNPATGTTQTTTSSFAAPAATPAPVSPAATTGFSVQSSAVLSEQMQLASALSTELLEKEGALSDRLMRFKDSGGSHLEMRSRATIGFDVTLAPTREEKDAVAVVEVIVANCKAAPAPPAVTAMIPSERTFNVAAVRNSSTSLGAGIATQFLGVSAGWLFGRNSYFLVQDQDTVAQVFQPSEDDMLKTQCTSNQCVGIRWMFRPVLGKRFVSPERRKVVLQLAFAEHTSDPQYGQAVVHTSWHRFDRKNGLVGEELPGRSAYLYSYPIRPYRLSEIEPVLNDGSIDDLGGGLVMVRLEGSFLAGTYVRVGGSVLSDSSSGLFREISALSFIAPAADLLSKNSFLVSRSGDRVPLTIDRDWKIWTGDAAVSVRALDTVNSELTVPYCELAPAGAKDPLRPPYRTLLLVAGKVYGLSDSPLNRQPEENLSQLACDIPMPDRREKPIPPAANKKLLTIAIPTATLVSSPTITLKALFAAENQSFQLHPQSLSPLSQADRLVLLKQEKNSAQFLLFGNRLSSDLTVDPPVALTPVAKNTAGVGSADNIRYVTLNAQQLQQYKFLVITRKGEAPRNLSTILRHPAALISEHFPDSPSSKQADLARLPSAAAGVWDRPERSVRGCGHTPLVESPVVVG